jgi:hypothetical protein
MQPAPDTGRRLALLVATSVYSDPDLRQLRAPGRDAAELSEVLRDPRIGGFEVQTLINAPSGEAQEGIEDFCADRHPGDQLLIYLSCHGVLDSNGRLYYAAANTRRQRLAATAVASAWLIERLDDSRAHRQIVVLDCCHSGAFARGAKGDQELALQQRFEPHGRGRVVLTASRGTEYSFEGGQASGEGVPSVFTHAIINGLRTGDADLDKDGLITVNDLSQYVYSAVRAAEPRQTPQLWTYGAEGSLLVAHSVRGAVIEPESLPEDLRITLESPRRRVRETAVAELADLLDAARPSLALAARQALERIAEEDHPQVAELARIAVGAPAGAAADQVRRELTERAHREEQARQEAARREAEDKARREAEEIADHSGRDAAEVAGPQTMRPHRDHAPAADEPSAAPQPATPATPPAARPALAQPQVTAAEGTSDDRLVRGRRADRRLLFAGSLAVASAVLAVVGLFPAYMSSYIADNFAAYSMTFGWFWFVAGTAALCLTAGVCTLIPRAGPLLGPGLLLAAATGSVTALSYNLSHLWHSFDSPFFILATPRFGAGFWLQLASDLSLLLAAGIAGFALARRSEVRLVQRPRQEMLSWAIVLLGVAGMLALIFHDLNLPILGRSIGGWKPVEVTSICATVLALIMPAWAAGAVPRRLGVALLAGWIWLGAAFCVYCYLFIRRHFGSTGPIIVFGLTLLALCAVTVPFARAASSSTKRLT